MPGGGFGKGIGGSYKGGGFGKGVGGSYKGGGFGTGVEFGPVLRGVLGLVRKHRVTLEANYMTLVMNVLCLEAMAKELEPDYNVLDASRPLLATHRRLPKPLFRAAMPLVRTVKKLRDGIWIRRAEAQRWRMLRQLGITDEMLRGAETTKQAVPSA